MLATGLVTLLVAAALLPVHPILVGLAAFGASLTKETGYPFVVALALLVLILARAHRTADPPPRALGATGVALGLALASGLNLLRFGRRGTRIHRIPRGADVDRRVVLRARRWTLRLAERRHPDLLAARVTPGGAAPGHPPPARVARCDVVARGLPALALVAVIGGLVAGLAAWWAPFGWWAWGPRLSLPWVLPILLVSLTGFGSTHAPARRRRHPALVSSRRPLSS